MKQWDGIFRKYGENYLSPARYLPEIVGFFRRRNVKRILDLGCGSGGHTVYLAMQGFELYAMDVSGEAVKIAKKQVKENRLKAVLKLGSIYHKLHFRDDFFDAVVCIRVIHHARIGDIRNAIDEIERILKPGGLIFVTVRKSKWKRMDRLKSKMIEARTFVPLCGDEKGVVHYMFNKNILKKEFSAFRIHKLWVEQGPRDWESYYCLLGELRK